MNKPVFYFARQCVFNVSARYVSGLAVKEDSVLDGVRKSPSEFSSVNSAVSRRKKTQLYCWGLSEHGALGLERFNNKHHTKVPRYKHKPTRHYFGESHSVTHVECGFGFSAFAVKTKSDVIKVYGCGINTDSQVGCQEPRRGNALGLVLSPAPINLGIRDCGTNVISLSAGRAHLAVVTDNEGVFTLGSNCYGQCGRPIIENEKYTGSSFVHNIKRLDGASVVSVVCGQDHTIMLNQEGKVFSCGWSADGQSGLGRNENISTLTRVTGDISSEVIVKVVGKCDTIMALSSKGEVFAWGNTEYSQLNYVDDSRSYIDTPLFLDKLKNAGKIVDIAAGGSFCMALNDEGEVFVWGYGILGAGPNIDKSMNPVALPKTLFGCNEFQPDSKVVSISCGLNHLAAITNYGNLYSWGRNHEGCLGIGHVRDQYFPYKVCIGALVNQVSCGVDHTVALCSPFV